MATLTILVKALNEECHIESCLRAAVDEAFAVGGEVILVDSLSTDRTVLLASAFPVRLVQFDTIADCGCASAVQLGYQFVHTEFVYVLDADMVLQPGFLAEALARLMADPSLGGVGGTVVDSSVRTLSDERRRDHLARSQGETFVSELGGGGLYRIAAVNETGYLAHRGLAAFEEAELGARLCSSGWRLLRLARPAVLHDGHVESNFQMLCRLWRNGRAKATGAVLRSAVGKPWFWRLARKQAFVSVVPACLLLVAIFATTSGGSVSAWLVAASGIWGGLFAVLLVRKRKLRLALWTLVFWHYFSVAALSGLLRRVPSPLNPVAGRELPTRYLAEFGRGETC